MTALVMTIPEVAELLRLAEKTVYAMAAEGELPAFKLRGQWRVRRVDFDNWLAARAKQGQLQFDAHESQPAIDSSPSKEADSGSIGTSNIEGSQRATQEQLHRRFADAIGASRIREHSRFDEKPFEMELVAPLPQRVRVYLYNATRPPGGRPLGEYKVQLIVPGQRRGQRASFDNSDGRIVLLAGYAADEDVFILWDAGLYTDFAWSRNVQVKAETIIRASAGKLATQTRQLRPSSGTPSIETVLAVNGRQLVDGINRRVALTRQRMLSD